ncbi:hypothetical protein Tco_1301780 [Tanacetum coccineum]
MVELVNQRKKHFVEERARVRKSKPMTQSQLRTYMSNYLKNQGTWKLTQLKKLTFEEVKVEFEKLVKQVDTFVPMSFEATKESLKRFGEELQTKTAKRLKIGDKDAQSTKEKIAEAKKDEPTKKKGKRRKQIARKGLHTNKDETKKDEDSDEDDSFSDGIDKVYISFGAMLKDITRDDLTKLFRIVMQRYGMDGPEDEYEKVFWGYLKNIVHCLNLDSAEIYMLTERSYPLFAETEPNVKIKKAYFLPGIVEGNPCLEYIKYIVFPWFNEFKVERKEENGGAKVFAKYEQLVADYAKGDLHPADLKHALLFYMDPAALSHLHSNRLFGARFPSVLQHDRLATMVAAQTSYAQPAYGAPPAYSTAGYAQPPYGAHQPPAYEGSYGDGYQPPAYSSDAIAAAPTSQSQAVQPLPKASPKQN